MFFFPILEVGTGCNLLITKDDMKHFLVVLGIPNLKLVTSNSIIFPPQNSPCVFFPPPHFFQPQPTPTNPIPNQPEPQNPTNNQGTSARALVRYTHSVRCWPWGPLASRSDRRPPAGWRWMSGWHRRQVTKSAYNSPWEIRVVYIYIITCTYIHVMHDTYEPKNYKKPRVLFVFSLLTSHQWNPSIHPSHGASWKFSMGISFLEPPWVFTLPGDRRRDDVGKMVNSSKSPLIMDIRQVRLDVICLKGGEGLCDVFFGKI